MGLFSAGSVMSAWLYSSGLKGIPPAARRIALLNQEDTLDDQVSARSMAEGLLAGGYDGVYITSMRDHPEDGTWIPIS